MVGGQKLTHIGTPRNKYNDFLEKGIVQRELKN